MDLPDGISAFVGTLRALRETEKFLLVELFAHSGCIYFSPEAPCNFSSQRVYPQANKSILPPARSRLYLVVLTPLTLSELFSRKVLHFFFFPFTDSESLYLFPSKGMNFRRVSGVSTLSCTE